MNYKFVLYIVLFTISKVTAQVSVNSAVKITLPTVALMDIEPSNAISFIFTSPSEAGRQLNNPATNSSKWINYTSAIALNGQSRRITAAVNELIPGVDIKLLASSATASGAGVKGISNGQITLTTNSQTLINSIGGAYTGNGLNSGHQLNISLAINSYNNLRTLTNKTVVITYTILE